MCISTLESDQESAPAGRRAVRVHKDTSGTERSHYHQGIFVDLILLWFSFWTLAMRLQEEAQYQNVDNKINISRVDLSHIKFQQQSSKSL